MCALLYYVCWYFAPGSNTSPYSAGSVFFVIVSYLRRQNSRVHQLTATLQVMYEFLYTAVGQAIAAYAPNAVAASLVNPLVIVTLVSFAGVVVPYSQIQPFWRYW